MIEFVKLELDLYGYYMYQDASNIEMNILGNLLKTDVGCSYPSTWKDDPWIFDDSLGTAMSSNITYFEKEGDYIYLSDLYADDEDNDEEFRNVRVKMTRKQFAQILNDWEEKVCKTKPKKVTIKHENDTFSIETSNE